MPHGHGKSHCRLPIVYRDDKGCPTEQFFRVLPLSPAAHQIHIQWSLSFLWNLDRKEYQIG